MKKIVAPILAATMVLGLAACGQKSGTTNTEKGGSAATEAKKETEPAKESKNDKESKEGKVFNIYAWNEEFKGFFEKYYKVPEGVTVNWIITPSKDGAYQQKLDEALLNQANAPADQKVDLFLAEADYILKYTHSDYTQDVKPLGVTDFSNAYKYTVQAASDANGVCKGVSFQCCPAAVIYRRSIAKDVLGTDDPAKVQTAMDSWEKFDDIAAKAKEKGYYMTASFAETYRTFSNNMTGPWVDKDNNLRMDPQIEAWINQTEDFVKHGYTLTAGIWDDEKNAQMFKTGKTMTFFGPAWYYNFSMKNAMDKEKGSFGDWAIVQGPQPYFWGGTWLLAPAGTDNPTMVADVMNTFLNNEEVCSNLVSKEMQFSNNQAVNNKFAKDPNYGNKFLGGQNDTAVFAEIAKHIKFENQTIYDQLLNEGLQTAMQEYFKGSVDKETALKNFYNYVNETYPAIHTPQ